MIKTLQHIYNKLTLIKKIPKLDILDSGVDEDGDPYVTLGSKMRFYGILPKPNDQKFYNLLPKKVKNKLSFDCFRVAQDVVIRYVEGGLKYRGPKKNFLYKVKSGDNVAEMGAYMGYFSMKMSDIVGENGKVYAIEPIPQNIRLLTKNFKFNNLDNCVIIPKGVWNKEKDMDFFKIETDNQSSSILMKDENKQKLILRVDSLDNMFNCQKENRINFMVIQLNGVEIEALEGLTSLKPLNITIAARYDRPKVDTIKHIQNMLTERGYSNIVQEERYIYSTLK